MWIDHLHIIIHAYTYIIHACTYMYAYNYNLGIGCKVDFVTIVFLHDLHVHVYLYSMHACICFFTISSTTHTQCIYTHSQMLRVVVASLPCSPPLLQPCHLPVADTDPQVTEIHYIVHTRTRTWTMSCMVHDRQSLSFVARFILPESPLQSPGTGLHQPPYFNEVSIL